MTNKTNKQTLGNFLIYSYFGIVPENVFKDSEKICGIYGDDYDEYRRKRAIMVAYRDATNQGAYNALFTKELENRNILIENSNTAQNESAKYLLKQIGKLSSTADHEEWHRETCKELVQKYKDSGVNDNGTFFTYGNAQKWVNMTMKYLWMLELLPDNLNVEEVHIPIDSFIIDAMWSDQNVNLPLRPENGDRSKTYAKPSDHVLGWSQWDDIMYGAFRSGLPEKYSLCWENDAWIEQAEKRKKADLKKQYEKFFK